MRADLDGDGFEEGQSAEEIDRAREEHLAHVGELVDEILAQGPEPDVPQSAPEYDVVDVEQVFVLEPARLTDLMHEFVESVKAFGVIEPLLVRSNAGPFKVASDGLGTEWSVVRAVERSLRVGELVLPQVLYRERTQRAAQLRAYDCAHAEGLPAWELIAGRRRLAAAIAAGRAYVPVIILDLNDEQLADVKAQLAIGARP